MDDVRYAGDGFEQARRVIDRAGTDFDFLKVVLDETTVAGRAKQDGGRYGARAQTVQDMAPDETARSCEQDLQCDGAGSVLHFFRGRGRKKVRTDPAQGVFPAVTAPLLSPTAALCLLAAFALAS